MNAVDRIVQELTENRFAWIARFQVSFREESWVLVGVQVRLISVLVQMDVVNSVSTTEVTRILQVFLLYFLVTLPRTFLCSVPQLQSVKLYVQDSCP